MALDLHAGIRVSDYERAKPWYRDTDGNEIAFGGAIEGSGA